MKKEKKINATEGARNFGNLIQTVAENDSKYIVERNGRPVAAIVPVQIYEQWKKERKAFFKRLDEIALKANVPEEEAEKLAEEAVRAVRKANRQK